MKFHHFQGIEIKAIGSNYVPYFITDKYEKVKGIFPEVFYELATKLNFTYKIDLSKDGIWGTQLQNGTWIGMIGDLKNEKYDIGI